MCYPPFTGAFNARRRGNVLLLGGVLDAFLNVVLSILLGLTLGAAGVAMASSLTAVVGLVFFARRLAAAEPDFELAPIWRTLALAVVASLPVAIPIALLLARRHLRGLVVGLSALAIFGSLGLLGYLFVALRLGLEEAAALMQFLAQAWSRMRPARRSR